jgi:hypothetical protein
VFSNSSALITVDQAADGLRFASRVEIEHYGLHEPNFPIRPYAATYPFRYDNDPVVDLLVLGALQPALVCPSVRAWLRVPTSCA